MTGPRRPFHAHVQRETFLVTLACMHHVPSLSIIDFFCFFFILCRQALQFTQTLPARNVDPSLPPLFLLPLPINIFASTLPIYITLSSTLLPQFHPSTHPSLSLMASAIRARFMEEIMRQQACERPATLALREDSHMISKMKPKVRIVHIFAPEVIKTDVENFRELVQRLTGKPTKRNGGKKKKAAPARVDSTETNRDSWSGEMVVKGELEEEKGELSTEGNSGGGFLSGFCDVDGIFQGLSDFPLLPLSSSHMDISGEAHVA